MTTSLTWLCRRPGGHAELCEWAADFYSHRLDRTRPLWEMALIEGLAEGRWAIAHKTHHCLVDGVGSVDVAYLLLDTEPNPPERPPASPPLRADNSVLRPFVPSPPQPIANAAQAGARVARAGVHAALHPREALERSAALAELIVRDELIGAPHTSLNVPIGSTRRFAVVNRPLDGVQGDPPGARGVDQRRRARGLHHRAAPACFSGAASSSERRGLRAMVPMNVRQSSERLMLGNRVSSLFVDLPVATEDARERHRRIVATTERLKSSSAATGAEAMIDLAGPRPARACTQRWRARCTRRACST